MRGLQQADKRDPRGQRAKERCALGKQGPIRARQGKAMAISKARQWRFWEEARRKGSAKTSREAALSYKVPFSFHNMAEINFTDLISSGVRAQQGQAWSCRCCVVFNQEFQPVLSLVLHLFPPAKKCCKPWEMVERRGRIPLMAPPYFPSICHTFHSWGKISLPSCSRRSVNPRWPGSETYSCTLLLSVGNQRLWLFTITFWKRKVFSYTWSIITVVKLKTSVVINVENSC